MVVLFSAYGNLHKKIGPLPWAILALVGIALVVLPVVVGESRSPKSGPSHVSAGSLELGLQRRWHFSAPDVPVLATALGANRIAVVGPNRDAVLFLQGPDSLRVSGFSEHEISALLAGRDEVWVGAGPMLLSINPETGEKSRWFKLEGGSTITSIAITKHSVWFTHVEGDGSVHLSELTLFPDPGRSLAGRVDLPLPRMVVAGYSEQSVIVQEWSHPYRGWEIREGSTRGAWEAPGVEELPRFLSSSRSWVLGANLRLPDGRYLHWFSDLRSLARAAVVSKVGDSSIERVTRYELPLGMVHALDEGTFILGAQEHPDGRDLVIFRVEKATDRSD